MAKKPFIKISVKGVLSLKYSPKQMEKVFKQAAFIVRGFLQQRFNVYSKGGGKWKGLADSTIKKKGSAIILRDLGYLFAAMNPIYKPGSGAYERITPDHCEIGYDPGSPHPGSNGLSIAKIVSFHQEGNVNLPQRKILVEPTKETMVRVGKIIEKAPLIEPGPPTFIE